MYERGIAATSMEDVMRATATSKSQLYHYFADKSALVCAVIEHQRNAVLAGQQPFLDDLADLDGLRAWRDLLVTGNREAATFGGCPVGSLAAEAATEVLARETTAAAYAAWQGRLAAGLTRMRDSGELSEDADVDALALGLLTAVQGGLLVSQILRSVAPLEVALDQAIATVHAAQRGS